MSPQITIYTKDYCPFCTKAKRLLESKNVPYSEIDVTHNPQLLEEMIEKSSQRRTVPQIFIGETHVGGCDDLYALQAAGKLDALLSS